MKRETGKGFIREFRQLTQILSTTEAMIGTNHRWARIFEQRTFNRRERRERRALRELLECRVRSGLQDDGLPAYRNTAPPKHRLTGPPVVSLSRRPPTSALRCFPLSGFRFQLFSFSAFSLPPHRLHSRQVQTVRPVHKWKQATRPSARTRWVTERIAAHGVRNQTTKSQVRIGC